MRRLCSTRRRTTQLELAMEQAALALDSILKPLRMIQEAFDARTFSISIFGGVANSSSAFANRAFAISPVT